MVLVIFSRKMRSDADLAEYEEHNQRMGEIVSRIPGFIDIKGYRGEDGEQIASVRFESMQGLDAWRNHPQHVETQRRARDAFYESYWVKVCPTIRDYEWSLATGRVERKPEMQSLNEGAS